LVDRNPRERAVNIAIEAETPGDNRTMFRVCIAQKVVATGLTAASAHWLVGLALERLTHPELANAGEELRARRRRRMRLREVLTGRR
jgi:hypothetical protein